jgi:hypothetical protein
VQECILPRKKMFILPTVAMQVGLRLAGIPYEGQKVVELKYKVKATQTS